jgi:hypothetical protein
MSNTINMASVFNSFDKRFADADAFIAAYTAEQVEEASRIALLHNRCVPTSLTHLEGIVKQLKSL